MTDIKAQYSMEFMLVFAFSLMIVLPLVGIINSEYNKSKSTLDASQAKKILDEIAVASQNVYYSGYPSRVTLEMNFPRGMNEINSTSVTMGPSTVTELYINITNLDIHNTILTTLPFNLTVSSLNPSSGKRRILIKAEKSGVVNITG